MSNIPRYTSAFQNLVEYTNIPPYLYRYEDQKWITRFWETGNLLISSFSNYKKYTDNQLGDRGEGSSLTFVSDVQYTHVTHSTVGHQSYCFCTSTILSRSLFPVFSRDSVFQIVNPVNFIHEISKCLPRVHSALFGQCIYLNHRSLSFQGTVKRPEEMMDESGKIPIEAILAQVFTPQEQFFLKEIKHQVQSEYRLIWNTDRDVSSGLEIHVPEALKFCRRLAQEEILP